MSGGLGAGMFRIHRIRGAMHDVVVDAILDIGRTVLDSKQAAGVGLVFGEEQFRRAFAVQPAIAGLIVIQFDHRVRRRSCLVQLGPRSSTLPTTMCCGTRPSAAAEGWPLPGPRFATVILIRMSSVSALAYSTNTSK